MQDGFLSHDSEVESIRELCNCGSSMICEKAFSHHLYDHGEDWIYTIQIFKILTCLTCHSVTVLLYSTVGFDQEDQQHWATKQNEPKIRNYKRTVIYAPPKQSHYSIPHPIVEIVNQAEAVFAKSPRASFILCRAVLEEICNDFKVPTESTNNKGKTYFINLNDRLSQLFEQEQMTEDLKTIIYGIKDLGNEGAHSSHVDFSKNVKIQDAEALLTLVNYVLERLYVDKYRQQESAKMLNDLKSKIESTESN